MAATATTPRPSPLPHTITFSPNSITLSTKLNLLRAPSSAKTARSFAPLALRRSEHDIVVIGAGIIGLSIARQLLFNSDLSVAIVDAQKPCFGATGAGQGYIWMAHRRPESDTWEMAMRGKQLWEEMTERISHQGLDPLNELGWKKTGSLLIGRTVEQLALLQERVKVLSQAGLKAEYLSATDLLSEEPALSVGNEGGAAFFPDDCQLDASKAVSFIEQDNKSFSSQGRYAEFYQDPALCLLRSGHGEVEAVQTSHNILYSKRAVVLAAGAWSGSLMRSLVLEQNLVPDVPVKPRKGHLLVLENNNKIHLNHGLMEVGYIDHQGATFSGDLEVERNLTSISMTATLDMKGNLVLGSSRQFIGFDREIDEAIVSAIWDRAGEYFPCLRTSLTGCKEIKIGHRPYMPDGKPIIGPAPGLPKVFFATGHEGCGLSLALSTAEMVADMILDKSLKVDHTPFRFPR